MRILACAALMLALAVAVQATSEQPFVAVGDEAIAASFAESPSLEQPVLMEMGSEAVTLSATDADAEAELEAITNPRMVEENNRILKNTNELNSVELLAHELGAPVLSEQMADKAEHEVERVERSLLAVHRHHVDTDLEILHENEHLQPSSLALLEEGADEADALEMVELESGVSRPHLAKENDYAFLDDPKHGGRPTVLKNLKGLDIYVVNTPIADNDNEIRPVKPPHPMSAANREKARLARLMRSQLVHDIPQPRAQVKPRTRINTLSAYESSLVDSRPLRRSRSSERALKDPIVGGHGARLLRSAAPRHRRRHHRRHHHHRFAEMGMESGAEAGAELHLGTENGRELPHFPRDPTAKPAIARAYGTGSSFDNRDGAPALLDDLLPIKAKLVEDLSPDEPKESKPNGW